MNCGHCKNQLPYVCVCFSFHQFSSYRKWGKIPPEVYHIFCLPSNFCQTQFQSIMCSVGRIFQVSDDYPLEPEGDLKDYLILPSQFEGGKKVVVVCIQFTDYLATLQCSVAVLLGGKDKQITILSHVMDIPCFTMENVVCVVTEFYRIFYISYSSICSLECKCSFCSGSCNECHTLSKQINFN